MLRASHGGDRRRGRASRVRALHDDLGGKPLEAARSDQIREAAEEAVGRHPKTSYWDKDWKKGGLQERRSVLLKENGFYNQLWCGCEFSIGHLVRKAPEELPEYIRRAVDELRLKE